MGYNAYKEKCVTDDWLAIYLSISLTLWFIFNTTIRHSCVTYVFTVCVCMCVFQQQNSGNLTEQQCSLILSWDFTK